MKSVLISPLNWGNGHATRMIPLITWLSAHASVTIGGNGRSLETLKKQFPELTFVTIPGVSIRLTNKKWLNIILMMFQGPLFCWCNWRENKWLKQNSKQFDIVISDNRYGLYNSKVTSVLVTHQTAPPFPYFKKLGHALVKRWLTRFDEVWIPDEEKFKLTYGFWQPIDNNTIVRLIGWLSAWGAMEMEDKGYWLLLASGPEPGKSNFIQTIKSKVDVELKIADGAVGNELNKLVAQASGIIAKSGYSTIMDVLINNKRALLIPTPGQCEQEQLARNKWLQTQCKIVSWSEIKGSTKLNLENVPTPSNIDMPNVWQNALLKILDEND